MPCRKNGGKGHTSLLTLKTGGEGKPSSCHVEKTAGRVVPLASKTGARERDSLEETKDFGFKVQHAREKNHVHVELETEVEFFPYLQTPSPTTCTRRTTMTMVTLRWGQWARRCVCIFLVFFSFCADATGSKWGGYDPGCF